MRASAADPFGPPRPALRSSPPPVLPTARARRGRRKVRIAGRGKGKSGGYRVVTYDVGDAIPAFPLQVLSKGSDTNFSDAPVNGAKAPRKGTVRLCDAWAAESSLGRRRSTRSAIGRTTGHEFARP